MWCARCVRLGLFELGGSGGMERIAAVRRVRLWVPDGELAGLYARIRESGPTGAGVVPGEVVDELAEYWVDRYDWRAYEERLNAFEHFATEVGGWDELMRRLGYDDYVVRDDRGDAPPASAAVTTERRGLSPDELGEVRWFNENLNASTTSSGFARSW
jgi:hypothetical protein